MLTLASTLVGFTLDATSKHLVRSIPRASYQFIRGVRINRVQLVRENFLRARGRTGLMLSWLVALLCVLILVSSGRALQSPIAQLGAGAALGGALGNLLEVLRRRSITDFVDVGWWPVFNVADVGIVVGLIVALSSMV